jgi:hypothetical protein
MNRVEVKGGRASPLGALGPQTRVPLRVTPDAQWFPSWRRVFNPFHFPSWRLENDRQAQEVL